MKGEFAEETQDDNHNTISKTMFPNFPPPHAAHSRAFKFHPHPDDSDTPLPITPLSSKSLKNEDAGGSIEVGRRPRGRPPGSKNKPKSPILITRHSEPPMAPYILEIPTETDVVDSLTRFTRLRNVGLCVLAASGAVANVTLKQPSTSTPGGTVTFHGRFEILSLSAVLLINTPPFGGFAFTITLAGPQGQIVGGKVVGPLVSSGTMYVVAASFNTPSYHRLPMEGEQDSGGCDGGEGQSGSPVSGGGGMGMYSCQLGSSPNSDAIWAPNATTVRPPPPY